MCADMADEWFDLQARRWGSGRAWEVQVSCGFLCFKALTWKWRETKKLVYRMGFRSIMFSWRMTDSNWRGGWVSVFASLES